MIKAQKSEIPTHLPTSWSDTLALEDPLLVWLTLTVLAIDISSSCTTVPSGSTLQVNLLT